jgi:hypothetical protein
MLSNSTQTNEPSKLPESSVENQGQEHDRTGQQKVHQALLETLSTARQRQRKVEKRVREDFEEMAGILERIWKNTIETKGVSPTEGTNGTSIGPAKQLATVESQRSDFNPSLAQSAIKDKNITELQAGEDNVTSVDAHGKVLKKARRVSFHDEVGASEREREMLRCFEEKIVGLEKRLGRFAQVEKENIKVCPPLNRLWMPPISVDADEGRTKSSEGGAGNDQEYGRGAKWDYCRHCGLAD